MMQTELLTKSTIAAIGEEITHELGAQFIKNYQAAHPADVKAYVIGKDIINQLLAQPGCEGIKFYNAINEFGQKTLVYVGLNAEGKALVNYPSINDQGALMIESGLVADRSTPSDSEEDWWWDFC
jgi:hypothetical protein